MDLFSAVTYKKVYERLQSAPAEDPWPPGREKLIVLLAPQKDAAGMNVGVMIKCLDIRGKNYPVIFLDYETVTRWMYVSRLEYMPKSVVLGTMSKEENKFAPGQKVVVVTLAHLQGVRVDPAWKTTLSDEMLRKLGELE